MIPGYYVRIAAFLTELLRPVGLDHDLPADPRWIKAGLAALIQNGIATKEDLKLAAVRGYDVIIREDLFPEE